MNIDNIQSRKKKLRGLWITRELPFPTNTGDRIMSARLIESTAKCGADITITGLFLDNEACLPVSAGIKWVKVEGKPINRILALFNLMPLVASVFSTKPYRSQIKSLSSECWDFVIFDQYGTGWAKKYFKKKKKPLLIHISHDHETSVYRQLAKTYNGSIIKKLALWQNYAKTFYFERNLVKTVDLVTAITREEELLFNKDAPNVKSIVISPGYNGQIRTSRIIGESDPTRVIMVGSYQWIAKQQNLIAFVEASARIFSENNIILDIVGNAPKSIIQQLSYASDSVKFHGYVDDIKPFFSQSRIAVVAEEIGGGFKIKFLDYIFNRVPVVTLRSATAGLSVEIKGSIICSDNMRELVEDIVANINNFELLNELQMRAFSAAEREFDWDDRGKLLVNSINSMKTSL